MSPATTPDGEAQLQNSLELQLDSWNSQRSDDQIHGFITRLIGNHDTLELDSL